MGARTGRGQAGLAVIGWILVIILLVLLAGGLYTYAWQTGTLPGRKLGGSVRVLGAWSGSELESFLAMVKPFEESEGVKVQFESTLDLTTVLTKRLDGRDPPDVAALPAPGQMAEFARTGKLVPLDSILDLNVMKSQYAQSWIDLATVDGKVYGVFVKAALKGLIWYDPRTFAAAGYKVPSTWDEVLALTDQITADAKTAWCIGLESGAASGWPATDWIEDVMLRTAGASAYDKWYRHQMAWTDPAVKRAWELFGKIATTRKYVYGGADGVLNTNFSEAPFPMFNTPPGCYLYHQGTFIQDFIQKQFPSLTPGEDFNFFEFPPIDPGVPKAVEVAGDLFGMFRDTPQARALLRYLTTADAHVIWVKRGGALSPNRRVGLENYPDPLSRKAAEILTSAEVARFNASDLMPASVNAAFWKGTLDYVRFPWRLDTILQTLEKVSQDAYK